MKANTIAIFWFRRDLRLHDNTALNAALSSGLPVQVLFIFDSNILNKLIDRDDARVSFIHATIANLDRQLRLIGATLRVEHGEPIVIWRRILQEGNVAKVFANRDYEPYAIERDESVRKLAIEANAEFQTFKDQVIFEKNEVVKDDGKPYTVFTPYSRRWKAKLKEKELHSATPLKQKQFLKPMSVNGVESHHHLPSLAQLGFDSSKIVISQPKVDRRVLSEYAENRNLPELHGTTRLGVHLRFGTVSVRDLVRAAMQLENETWLNELIWREFFMQILWHFPHVVKSTFRPEYEKIGFRHDEKDFALWCEGRTGYPIVDAGLRELNETGFMHNRVRMIAASFLVKHLLIDYRWGEAYFARRLLDFDLAANNGNWQWVTGSGCDAAPYFRVFNPLLQQKKFDPDGVYARRWVNELGTEHYPSPMVEHAAAREKALYTYRVALKNSEL